MVKPVGEATHTLRSATKASHPGVTGFKTYNAQAMELESKTRDSMFKKIALKLLPNGGEMRMRLDPPHLGTLDVGLVVEKGVVVKLSLAAERSDVANMLERHLPDLKQYLQDMGLSVKHAEVVTQDFHRRGEHQGQQHDDKPSFGDTEDQEQEHQHPAPLRQAGYLTQDGLDFWV